MLYALKETEKITKYGKYNGTDILVLSGAGGETLFAHCALTCDGAERVRSVEMRPFRGGDTWSLQPEIFWEESVRIRQPSCSYGTMGEVFDVLLPFSDALARENGTLVEAKANQPILISFILPHDAERGEYDGEIAVITDKCEYLLFVRLTVFGFSLSKRNNARSAFAVWYENEKVIEETPDAPPHGEKYDTYLKYYELLKKYRISATELPVRSARNGEYCAACDANIFAFEPRRGISPEDTDNFIGAAKIAAADDGVACYSLPYDVVVTDGVPAVDTDKLYALLTAMVNESDDTLDLFEKAYFYVTFIDEPSAAMFPLVRSVTDSVRETLFRVAKDCDFTAKPKVRRSLLSVENVVPSWPEEKLYGGVDTWCPTFSGWHAPEFVCGMRSMIDLGSRNWWYGCVSPWYPFPSYHLDEPLLGARSEGILRGLFGVEGNLYWAVNSDRHYDKENKKMVEEDVYGGDFFWKESNGEGILTFDGRRFGVSGPLASLRLAAVCQGHQDYEYFLLLKDRLEKLSLDYSVSFDAQGYLRPIAEKAFYGTAITDESKFTVLRRELAESIVAARKGVAVQIGDPDARRRLAEVTVYAPAGAKVCGGGLLKIYPAGSGEAHVFAVELGKSDVYFVAEAEIGGEIVEINRLVSPPVVPLDIGLFETERCVLETRGDRVYCRTDGIDNDCAPRLTLNGSFDFTRLDSVILETQSLVAEPFSLSVVFVDGKGRNFNAGYTVADKETRRARIHFNPAMQLNGWREVKHTTAFSHYDEQTAAMNAFDIFDVRKIIVEIQAAREFCSLAPRQLRYSACTFAIDGVSYTEWTDKNPHDYAFLRVGKEAKS
ncbi:MAG: hypothetical protein DBX59_11030 [Bacillota bacterium]|nr:MAG: hypothetical protein DBX59_11030 [Bacillota bacterium]